MWTKFRTNCMGHGHFLYKCPVCPICSDSALTGHWDMSRYVTFVPLAPKPLVRLHFRPCPTMSRRPFRASKTTILGHRDTPDRRDKVGQSGTLSMSRDVPSQVCDDCRENNPLKYKRYSHFGVGHSGTSLFCTK